MRSGLAEVAKQVEEEDEISTIVVGCLAGRTWHYSTSSSFKDGQDTEDMAVQEVGMTDT